MLFKWGTLGWTSQTMPSDQRGFHTVLSYHTTSNLLKTVRRDKMEEGGKVERGERIWAILQMLLWDFRFGAVRCPANGASLWVGVWVQVCVLCYNAEVTTTERKRPLHLIKGSLKHSSPCPYTVTLLQALSHFSHHNFLLTRTPPPRLLLSLPHYLVSFFCVRQVACQHPIITYSVFLCLLPPPARPLHDCLRTQAGTFYRALIPL